MSDLVIDLTQDGGDGSSNSPVVNSIQDENAENGAESRISAMVENCGSSDPTQMQGSPIMTQASTTSFQLRTNVGKIFYAPAETDNRAKRTRAEPLWYVPRHAYPPEIEYKLAPSQLGPVAKKAKINQCLAAKKEAAQNITHEVLCGNLVIDPTPAPTQNSESELHRDFWPLEEQHKESSSSSSSPPESTLAVPEVTLREKILKYLKERPEGQIKCSFYYWSLRDAMIGNELIDPTVVTDAMMNETMVGMQEEGIFLRVREQKRFDKKKLPGVEVMYTYLPNYKFEYFMEPVWNSQEQRSMVQCVVPHSSSVESGSIDTDSDDEDYDDDDEEEDEDKEREALELQKREVRIKTEYVDKTEGYKKGQAHGLSMSEVNSSYRGGEAADDDLPDLIKPRDEEGNEEESVGAVLSSLEEDIVAKTIRNRRILSLKP